MGKIKTVVMGDEKSEEEARKKAEAKRAQKKLALSKTEGLEKEKAKASEIKAEPPVATEKVSKKEKVAEPEVEKAPEAEEVKKEVKKKKADKVASDKYHFARGQKYLKIKVLVDKNKTYTIQEALELVKKTSLSKFDGTVEVIFNVVEKGQRGLVALPHGTGKEVRVKIADEALIEAISKGAPIDFDVLVAHPMMMAKLAKVAKILGPKGLMPNPKTGTIGEDTEKIAKNLSKGQVQFKTESDYPIIHSIIGKVSFENDKLTDNFNAFVKAITKDKIRSIFVKATMGPAIKVQV